MGWLRELSGKTAALDTAPLIYFMEENPVFLDVVKPFFTAMERGDFQVVTSSITLTEVLVNHVGNMRWTVAVKSAWRGAASITSHTAIMTHILIDSP